MSRLHPDEIALGVSYLAGRLPQGRIGIGPAAVRNASNVAAASEPGLLLQGADSAIEAIIACTGKGSIAQRQSLLADLFSRCTAIEQKFLIGILVSELRQGALDGVMVEAVAAATGSTASEVRRAHMLSGDLAAVADTARRKGDRGLAEYRLVLGKPVQSMLAQSADDVAGALGALSAALLDYKMDGARVQVHKDGPNVSVFSRRLNDVSASVPEIVETVSSLDVESLVLDGETIALNPAGRPLPFQTTMRRFGRTKDVAVMRAKLPLSVLFFDCLHVDGTDLIDRAATERLDALDTIVPALHRMPRQLTDDVEAAETFLANALAAGHEGIMAKDPKSLYEAGKRGGAWLKIKQSHTLDLVVLAAEWGSGRRRGWLSNLHLGARDEATGQFTMLGKTFKGLTDATLAWQTEALLAREIGRDAYTVYVRPELVVEIRFNEVQTSAQYPGGMSLRFARVKGYRPDKSAADADTVETVRAIHLSTASTAS